VEESAELADEPSGCGEVARGRCSFAWNFTVTVVYRVHSPTNALFIKPERALKFTLKFTLSLLLHVSFYDHHQGDYDGAWLKLYYVKIQ
jgi:hypothetical protein